MKKTNTVGPKKDKEKIWENTEKRIKHHISDIHTLNNQEIENIFMPFKDKEIQEKDFFGFLENMIKHISNLVKKERMENQYIDNHMGKLSAREILSNGKVFYMNPCLDFVIVTLEGLKKSGIEDTKLVIDELSCPWNMYKIHFGVEIPHQGKTYYIDYRTNNDVYLGKGKFESKYDYKWESVANTIKVDAKDISSDDTIYDLVGRWLLPLKYFNRKILTLLQEKLKHDNTPEQYEFFRNQNDEKIHIHRETHNQATP